MTNKVLVIAYHFPPMTVSSGVQRTLNFVRHLRTSGWESLVLTTSPRAYSATGDEQMADIPTGMRVERAFALDAARHLSIAGRYPAFVADPDRWASWLPFAIRVGRKMVREDRPAAIFATYPIATALAIGCRLADWSGLPFVADFRDSMYDEGYPEGDRERAIARRLDAAVVERCDRAIFTTPSARDMYAARYPHQSDELWTVIPNGYDEQAFARMRPAPALEAATDPLVLLHSGTLYPIERNPMPFFATLGRLRDQGAVDPSMLKIRLRATGHDDHYRRVIEDAGLQDMIEVLAPLPYSDALAEMSSVDALLLFQAEGCNHQIPAKLYEYLRARRPIIALTHPAGDTATVLRAAGADNLLPLEDEQALTAGLPALLDKLRVGDLRISPMETVRRYSREQGAAELAAILNEVTASGS